MVLWTANVLGNPLSWLSLASGAIAAVILIWFLFGHPPLNVRTKLLLTMGIFVLPLLSALSGNVVGYQVTMDRDFCGSCHVMEPWTDDSKSEDSVTLAAVHGRNNWFGNRNCYTCHADYDMYGLFTTKLNGMVHVYHYLLSYSSMDIDSAVKKIELYKPMQNTTCMQCHTTKGHLWSQVPDHRAVRADVVNNAVSCASRGCHGPAHPFSKIAKGEDLGVTPSGGPLEKSKTATTSTGTPEEVRP